MSATEDGGIPAAMRRLRIARLHREAWEEQRERAYEEAVARAEEKQKEKEKGLMEPE